MPTTIKLKNGSGAPLAGDLVQGEPALDLTNKRLYTEDSGGTVIEVGTNPSTIDINAGSIDGVTLGTNSPVTSAVITTADINGGTIDAVTIGGASAGAGTFTTFTSTGIDDNAASTAITIESDGDVLFNKTSSDFGATTGFEFSASRNAIYLNRDDESCTILGRNNSDGDIVAFRKDGSQVGSIGTLAGTVTVGSGNTRFLFDDGGTPSIKASTESAARDAAVDLGDSNTRFKDLYLSGGAYIGGTVAANYLDDYEEGTWTPVDSTTGPAYSSSSGKYTKTGNQVTVWATITWASTSNSAGVEIQGLPFTKSGGSTTEGNGSFKGTGAIIGIVGFNGGTSNELLLFEGGSLWTNAELSTKTIRSLHLAD